MNTKRRRNARMAALASSAVLAAWPAVAADVTPDRLVNADKEPHNWLMNHRTYDAQRYSPLARINKDNVKDLKLVYALAIGGTSANENLQSTPLAEDGFLYIVDQWGVVYKIDVRSGDMGRIVWRMDPGQEKLPLSNRGAASWGNLVLSTANYPARVIATNKDNGKVVWETNLHDQPDVQLTAAVLPVKDKIIVGAAGGDRGARRRDRQADLAQIHSAGARRARQRDLERQEQRLAGRRRRHVDHRFLRHRDQPGDLGDGQSGADVRPDLPPRRQPLHQQHDLVESRHRAHELVFPVHARRPLGLRRGTLPHPHRRARSRRCGRSTAQADHPFRPQRLSLHLRAQQRADAAGEALCREHQLDRGHRPEDRQAPGLRSRQGHPDL